MHLERGPASIRSRQPGTCSCRKTDGLEMHQPEPLESDDAARAVHVPRLPRRPGHEREVAEALGREYNCLPVSRYSSIACKIQENSHATIGHRWYRHEKKPQGSERGMGKGSFRDPVPPISRVRPLAHPKAPKRPPPTPEARAPPPLPLACGTGRRSALTE